MTEGRGFDMDETCDMDENGYTRLRKWPVADDPNYIFPYRRRPNDLPDNFHTTHDIKGTVPMVGLPENPSVGSSSEEDTDIAGQEQGCPESDSDIYVEMASVEPEYANIPKGNKRAAPDPMNYSINIPAVTPNVYTSPRAMGEAKDDFKPHEYVNVDVPSRSRLTSDGEGCSPEFDPRPPGVSDVSGWSPDFLSRSPGASDAGSSAEFFPQSPGVPLRPTSSQPEEPDYVDGGGNFAGMATEDSMTHDSHVDMEPVAGGRYCNVEELKKQGYRCIVFVNETDASRAFGLSGTCELEVDMATPAIIVTPLEGYSNAVIWPLHYIRRYGTNGNWVFHIEAGRRCHSGPGIFTFTVPSGTSEDLLAKVKLASEIHLPD